MKRLILAGGSGFIGQLLADYFAQQGFEVVVLTRGCALSSSSARTVTWDGESVGPWVSELEGASVVINLAGRSVDCRYTPRNQRDILDSRVKPTLTIARAINLCARPPGVWLNASTATLYKHTFGPAHDEAGMIGGTREAKDEFSVQVGQAWEAACLQIDTPFTRKVLMRMAMVLGHGRNSVFPVLSRLVKFGLGGRMGTGKQFVSWIHQQDLCRAIEWLVDHNIRGVVNIASPNPLPNAEMMRIFRDVLGAPIGLPAPEWMLELGAFFLRTESELILKSRRVIPAELLRRGFEFNFPEFQAAIVDLRSGSPLTDSAPTWHVASAGASEG